MNGTLQHEETDSRSVEGGSVDEREIWDNDNFREGKATIGFSTIVQSQFSSNQADGKNKNINIGDDEVLDNSLAQKEVRVDRTSFADVIEKRDLGYDKDY